MRNTNGRTAGPENPTVRFAEIELDGQSLRLCYDFNAIAECELACGCNLIAGLQRRLSDLTANEFRGLFWAALRRAHPKITLGQAGTMIRLDTLWRITAAMAEAFRLSFPDQPTDPPKAATEGESAGEAESQNQEIPETSGSSCGPQPGSPSA